MACASSSKYIRSRYFAFLLCFSFILGFLSGTIIASNDADHIASMVRIAIRSEISPISLFAQIMLPFSFTILIYGAEKRNLIFLLCFLSSITYGFTAVSVYFIYGTRHWLVSPLLVFSGTLRQASLLWLWLRNFTPQSSNIYLDTTIALSVSVVAAVMDVTLISPFLSLLFS